MMTQSKALPSQIISPTYTLLQLLPACILALLRLNREVFYAGKVTNSAYNLQVRCI